VKLYTRLVNDLYSVNLLVDCASTTPDTNQIK